VAAMLAERRIEVNYIEPVGGEINWQP
jgi:hypothetical protein